MYLFRLDDGSIMDAYVGFDPDNPDLSKMGNVEEILVISKVLQKQVKLVLKPKEERAAIKKAMENPEPEQPKKHGRKSKKAE